MQPERRRVLRFHFAASAEFIDQNSGTRISGHVTDLSLNGCSLEVAERLRVGTPGTIKISTKANSFESAATVVYADTGTSVGLTFHGTDAHSTQVLQNWLVAAMQGKPKEEI